MDQSDQLTSLLDIVTKRFNHEGRGSFSRMLIIAQTDGDHGDHSVQVQRIVDDVKHHAKVTGFCLEQMNSVFIVIECDPEIIMPFLKALVAYSDEDAETFCLKELRVLASVEDAAMQYFPAFQPLSLSLVKEKDVDLEQEYGDMITAGTSVHINMMKIGHTIKETMSEVDPREVFDDFKKRFSLLLPSNERIIKFTKRSEFFTVGEFIAVYDSPTSTEIPSEMTWPMEAPLEYSAKQKPKFADKAADGAK